MRTFPFGETVRSEAMALAMAVQLQSHSMVLSNTSVGRGVRDGQCEPSGPNLFDVRVAADATCGVRSVEAALTGRDDRIGTAPVIVTRPDREPALAHG